MTDLAINGTRVSGLEVRSQNLTACLAVSNIVRTSLGPAGLDKMLVDDIGDVTITNDGATILKQLDLSHPCAKVLVELANLQDKEIGDGTTSVVIIAAELLRRANELVQQKIHPTSIISGFQLAKRDACRYLAENLAVKVSSLSQNALLEVAKTSMSSKIIGVDSDFFGNMVAQAMQRVETLNSKGKKRYPVKAVEIIKVTGGGLSDSELINGYACEETRASQQMPRGLNDCNIALIDFDLRKKALKFGIQIEIDNPEKIEEVRQREFDLMKEQIDCLLDAGVNVILTTGGIDDTCQKYLVERNCIGIRRIEKKKMRRIGQLIGGKLMVSLADDSEEGTYSVPEECIGHAERCEERRVGDRDIFFILGCASTKAQTILIRGVNWYMLEEIERSVHDALCVMKRVLESGRVVPGGGACEAALSVYLEHVADQCASREQLAIAEFAQAMLIIPKTLAINGGFDSAELVGKLRGYHAQAQADENFVQRKFLGLDLDAGKVRDRLEGGVLEPAMSKIKAIKFATEACITILRIDDAITLNRAENPKGPDGR